MSRVFYIIAGFSCSGIGVVLYENGIRFGWAIGVSLASLAAIFLVALDRIADALEKRNKEE